MDPFVLPQELPSLVRWFDLPSVKIPNKIRRYRFMRQGHADSSPRVHASDQCKNKVWIERLVERVEISELRFIFYRVETVVIGVRLN